MSEVQNIGASNYTQYQPSQYPTENYTEDYSMPPEVYDENAAQMKAASKSRLGATLLTTAVIAGLALWGGHTLGSKNTKNAVANYEKAKKALEEVEKAAEEGCGKWFGENHCGSNLLAKIKKLCKPFKSIAEKGKEEAEKGSKKAAKSAEDAAKEVK